MRVPDLAGLKNATEALNATETPSDEPADSIANSTEPSRRRTFGRPRGLLELENTARSVPAPQKQGAQLEERQSSCPKGKGFYRCANGFTGCCSHDPCDPGQTCSDGKEAGDKDSATATSSEDGRTTTNGMSSMASAQRSQDQSTMGLKSETELLTASSSGDSKPTTSASDSEERRFAPSCPRADGVKFSDVFNITYVIHCNTDNAHASDEAISVGVGGYAQCFTACSKSETCAGFTFVGLDGGICYLKNEMPKGAYVPKAGRNYVSCSKTDPSASALTPTPTEAGKSTDSKKAPIGAIVGGVLGGVALLAFLIFLIAFFARRKRKKIERKRATIVTHIQHGPIQPQQPLLPTHQRQASTSHDVFAPFGGNAAANGSYHHQHTRQRSIYRDNQNWI